MSIRELIPWDKSWNVPVRQRSRMGRSLFSLQDDMNHLFRDFFGEGALAMPEAPSMPAVDIIENDKNFKLKAELPGMDPDDVDVSVTDGFLTIKGEHKEEKEEKEDNYLRQEISYGSFQRTIALPETANCEKAEASFKNGVLKVEVPKKAEAVQKPKKLAIKKAA